jgi:hypothetical protein
MHFRGSGQAIAKQSAERRIYCELELNLRIKPRKRLKRDKPDALAVPDAPNMTWSMHCPAGECAHSLRGDFMADRLGPSHACKHALPGNGWSGVSAVERAGRL